MSCPFFCTKKKKTTNVAAIIIGVVALAAFTPVAFYSNKRKKKWGIGSVALSVTKEPSRTEENKDEIVITCPGVGFIASCWKKAVRLAGRVYNINRATRRAMKAEAVDCDECFCDDEATVEVVEESTEE